MNSQNDSNHFIIIDMEDGKDKSIYERKWDMYVNSITSIPSKEVDALKKGRIFEPENQNILDHLLKARIIGEVLCDDLGVMEGEKEDIISALTIHDALVLKEKAYIKRLKRSGKSANYENLQTVKKLIGENLRQMGFSENVINLTDENITHEEGGPKHIGSMIVFIADAMLSGKEIMDVRTRVEMTRKGWRSDKNVYDQETADQNIKYWNEFFIGAPGHGERSHDVVQLESANNVCRILTNKLKNIHPELVDNPKYSKIFGNDGDYNLLYLYIKDRVDEKLSTYTI